MSAVSPEFSAKSEVELSSETPENQNCSYGERPIAWPILERFLDFVPKKLEDRLALSWGMRVEIRRGPVVAGRMARFSEAVEKADVFGLLAGDETPLRGFIGLSPALVSAFVEFVLGHRAGAAAGAPKRALTPFEYSLFRPFVRQVLDALADAVAPAGALRVALEGWGDAATAPDCPALQLPLTVVFAGIEEPILLTLPLRFLAPLDDAMNGIFHGIGAETEDLWRESLEKSVSLAQVTLDAILHEQMLPLGAIRHLAVGQSLAFDAPAEPLITLTVSGAGLAKGRLGRSGPRMAVRLETGVAIEKETGK